MFVSFRPRLPEDAYPAYQTTKMSQNNAETAHMSRPDALEARQNAYDSCNTVKTPVEATETPVDASNGSNGSSRADEAASSGPTTSPDVDSVIHRHPKMTTRSNKSAVLASADSVDDFKRARTKFTSEQIRELEAFFAQQGPHPTRTQRLAMAEKLQIPPRVVQIYLQNRRQRDAKNKNAAATANSAKEKAKISIAGTRLSAQAGVTEPTENAVTVEHASASAIGNLSILKEHGIQFSSDVLESTRSFEGLSGHSTFTFSSSPNTVSLNLDELETPSRPASQLFVAGTGRRATQNDLYLNNKLWTRILSSPPSPATSRKRLYETLRQSFLAQPTEPKGRESSESSRPAAGALETVGVNLPANEGKSLERKSSKIDLACAIARDVKVGAKPTAPLKVSESHHIESGRPRTASGVKRLREETNENEAPRKRTASLTWSARVATPVASKAGSATEGLSTPENTIASSSPGSSVAPSVSSSATLYPDPIQGLHSSAYKELPQSVSPVVQRIDALSELEANAALVLALLPYNV